MTTPTVLEKIIAEKRKHIAAQRVHRQIDPKALHRPSSVRGFSDALKAKQALGLPAVIAEIKKGSPSKGVIRPNFDVASIAASYERHGATCLSCLTDEPFFFGCDADLATARSSAALPVLRKDFIIDEFQIYESFELGADCILLIVSALTDEALDAFYALAIGLGLDVLIEVHDAAECQRALRLAPKLLGINNRNLHDFSVSLDTTLGLLTQIPSETLIITESGIHTESDVHSMWTSGVGTFLVGEAFMRHPEPGERLSALFGAIQTTATSKSD